MTDTPNKKPKTLAELAAEIGFPKFVMPPSLLTPDEFYKPLSLPAHFFKPEPKTMTATEVFLLQQEQAEKTLAAKKEALKQAFFADLLNMQPQLDTDAMAQATGDVYGVGPLQMPSIYPRGSAAGRTPRRTREIEEISARAMRDLFATAKARGVTPCR